MTTTEESILKAQKALNDYADWTACLADDLGSYDPEWLAPSPSLHRDNIGNMLHALLGEDWRALFSPRPIDVLASDLRAHGILGD